MHECIQLHYEDACKEATTDYGVSMPPKVSVLIPTYNMATYLGDAIESVLFQTYQDFEIIIVDDGSTDNTKELVKMYEMRFPGKLTYIYKKNSGLAAARNTGIKHARGKYIALLDADDKYYPQRLEKSVKAIETSDDIGLVHADDMEMDADGNIIGSFKRDKKCLSGKIFQELYLRTASVSCPTVLVRKACFESVGLFDENLSRLGCEDRDAWLRIALKYTIIHVDSILAYYRHHPKGMSKNRKKMLEARHYVADKFYYDGTVDKTLWKKALGKIHREIGDEYLKDEEFRDAMQEYVRSFSYWPLAFWPWINFVKALCWKSTRNKLPGRKL